MIEENKHENTHQTATRLRKQFNDVSSTMDKARNAVLQADMLMEKVIILEKVADKLGLEDLESGAFTRNIHLYVDDYLMKLEKHVMKMERYGRL